MSRRGWRWVVPAALVSCLGAGAGVAFVGSPAAADTAAAATTTPACPTYNPPNTMTLVAGTPQSAKLGAPYATDLQVSISNTNGCPVTTGLAGLAVTFTAPGSGPSGRFASSGSNAVLVGTNAQGVATVPQFSANRLPGGFTVVASSDFGTVAFSLVNTASGVPATISAVSASRSATAGSRYAQPLAATVLDADGNPVEGVQVVFTLGAGGDNGGGGGGGATTTAGASFSSGGTQATETTDSSGVATSPSFTANGTAGTFTASASTAGIAEPVGFRLANVAGKPPRIGPLTPAKQSAAVGARYRKPLRVKVLDGNGKPLAGASVTFTLGSGSTGGGAGGSGGSDSGSPGASFVGGSNQMSVTTDANGVATSSAFSANTTAGRFTATATTTGTTQAASFSLDNLAAKAPTIRLVGKATRSAVVGGRYREQLAVKVRDGKGKPLQGATVTFTLGSDGGATGGSGSGGAAGASFVTGSSQATATTNAAGIGTSPAFSANTTAGRFTATATTTGTTQAASFSLDNLAGKAPAVTLVGKASRSAVVGDRYGEPLAVKVRDGSGNALQGATVTFTLGSSSGATGGAGAAGASFATGSTQATATTNAAGIASSPALTANTTAGRFTASAATSGDAPVASFDLRNLAGSPATITPGAAASESTGVGTRFPIRLAVSITDAHQNPVAGVAVTFAAPARGPGGRFPGNRRLVRVKTDAKGVAVAPSLVANERAGGWVVRATAADHSAAFALVNQPAG